MKNISLLFLSLGIAGLLLSGCSDKKGESTPQTVRGQFIDDTVQGLNYACSSGSSDVTNANGEFTCHVGDDVTFSVGSASIGTIAAQSGIITPYSLFPNNLSAALNLARLLQSLDGDGDSNNGMITLDTYLAVLLPTDTDFTSASFETYVETALNIVLIGTTEAQKHLNDAIIEAGGEIPDGGNIPVANAGPDQNIPTSSTVTLDGSSSSDADGDTLIYSWHFMSMPADSNATLSDATVVNPTFIADLDGAYVIELTVNDGTINSAADIVVITAANFIPVANAGADQIVNTYINNPNNYPDTVTLDGSASFDDNLDTLTYHWSFVSQPPGSNATLSDASVVSPTFVTDLDGAYVVQLVVNDGTVNSAADAVTITAISNSGTLDDTFDGDGIVGHDYAYGNSIALDSTGNLYVTGYSYTTHPSDGNMTIWKYKSDGTLDTSFNGDGIVMHPMAEGKSIASDSAGNVYVTGYSDNGAGDSDMVIWKYRSDGTLDTTFGSDGTVIHNGAAGGNGTDIGNAIALDNAGNIYVTGYSDNETGNKDMVTWKYRSDGTLDTTFGGDGIIVHNGAAGGDGFDAGKAIALDSAGNIYVAGLSRLSSTEVAMVIWKYRSDGTLYTPFDGDGIVIYNTPGYDDGGINIYYNDAGISIAIDGAENIYVTGYTYDAFNEYGGMRIWKYRSDGNPDDTFDVDGTTIYTNGGRYYSGDSMVLDSAGNLYVAGGYITDALHNEMVTWKYK